MSTRIYNRALRRITQLAVTILLSAACLNAMNVASVGPRGTSSTNVTLTWDAPVNNVDGTACSDLAGFVAYMGLASGQYDITNVINSPTVLTNQFDMIDSDTTYYFAVKAFNSYTNFSDYSEELVWTSPDTIPPELVSVSAIDSNLVELKFSDSMDPSSISDVYNYRLNGTHPNIATATTNDTVQLTVLTMSGGLVYMVSVSNVQDTAGNVMNGTYSAFFQYLPQLPIETIELEAEDMNLDIFEVVDDPEASGGKYVRTKSNNAGSAFMSATVGGGDYKIWARTKSPNPTPAGRNSFFINVKQGAEIVIDDVWDTYLDHDSPRTNWVWDVVSTRCGGTTFSNYCDPVTINIPMGEATASVNQKMGGSNWVWVGNVNFASGTNGYVRIRTAGTTGYVIADAVKFTLGNSTTEVIVDNLTAEKSTGWTLSTWAPGYYGSNYLHDNNIGKGTKTVTYRPNLAASGNYNVSMWWPAEKPQYLWANNVPVDLVGSATNVTVTVTFGGRESYTQLDKIVLTRDPDFWPVNTTVPEVQLFYNEQVAAGQWEPAVVVRLPGVPSSDFDGDNKIGIGDGGIMLAYIHISERKGTPATISEVQSLVDVLVTAGTMDPVTVVMLPTLPACDYNDDGKIGSIDANIMTAFIQDQNEN